MAAKKDPHVFFPLLLEAFREEPGNVHKAAKAASVGWPTAQRAWEKGSLRHGFPPIKQVIQAEQQRARALISAEQAAAKAARSKEIAQAADQAITARKQEGQMTGLVRGSSLAALTAVTTLSKEARALANAMASQVAVERNKLEQWTAYERQFTGFLDENGQLIAPDPNAIPPSWSQGPERQSPPTLNFLLNVLNRSADYAQKIASCARVAMDMERLHLGEPLGVIQHEHSIKSDMSLEELEIRRQNANQAIDRSRVARGIQPASSDTVQPKIGQLVVVR